MKKILISSFVFILGLSPILAQEIKSVYFDWEELKGYSGTYFLPNKVKYAGNGNYVGIYIIEVEGVKYIINAAGGIIRHEAKEKKE